MVTFMGILATIWNDLALLAEVIYIKTRRR